MIAPKRPEYKLRCPYCGNPLANQQTGCCGEVGHGYDDIDDQELDDPRHGQAQEINRKVER